MCCLFGLLDYNKVFSSGDKNRIISVLSKECEARGTDATGIAYNATGRLCVYKRPLPANKLHYAIPNAARFIMGHTRMKTTGTEKKNYNNHPFLGYVQSGKFALSHNGIIYNDTLLRKSEVLPTTKIETDSYIAVQLIEKQRTLNFKSLKQMAEIVEGSFTFTILDSQDNLYIVKGNNPLCLYHYPKAGFYLYASTEEILMKALTKLNMQGWHRKSIVLSEGDILRVDGIGKLKWSRFDRHRFGYEWGYGRYSTWRIPQAYRMDMDALYLQDLKSTAFYFGYSPDDVDRMLACGYTGEEIEDMLYTSCFNKAQAEDERIYDYYDRL